MKRLISYAIFGVLGMAPAMFADIVDYMLNVNGTTYCDTGSGATCDFTGSLPSGITTTVDGTYGGTGLGTLSLTFNPGPGSYHVGAWLFEELFPATGYNEYGVAGGSLGAGESWQIDVPDYDYNGSDPNFGSLPAGAGTIVANASANTLDNTNYVPGNTDAYDFVCTGLATCNDFTSMALAFNFTLGPSEEELLSFSISTTRPTSGFYLEQIAPVDGVNTSEINYFFTATATTMPTGITGVPEPSSWIPLLAFVGFLAFAVRRRSAVV